MIDLLLMIALALYWLSMGRSILLSFLPETTSIPEKILYFEVMGMGVTLIVVHVMGMVGFVSKNIFFGYLLCSFLASVYLQYSNIPAMVTDIRYLLKYLFKHKIHLYLSMIVAIYFLYAIYNLLCCLTPVINGDSLSTYLYVPKMYIENQAIADISFTNDERLPQNIMILNMIGLLFGSTALAQLLSGWLCSMACALAVYVVARKLSSQASAILVAILFYSMPALSWLICSAKIDIGYTMFELTFWAMFAQWIITRKRSCLFVSSIYLGFAIGSKYHSLFALMISVIFVFIYSYKLERKTVYIFMTCLLFTSIALSIGSLSYVTNFVTMGDFFYPFLTESGVGRLENANNFNGFHDYPRFLYNMIMGKDYFLKISNYSTPPIGGIVLTAIPFMVLAWFRLEARKRKLLFTLGCYFFVLTIAVFYSAFPYQRHFLPAIALLFSALSISFAYLLKKVGRGMVYVVCLMFVIYSIVFFNIKYKLLNPRYRYLTNQITQAEYLEETLFSNGTHMNLDMLNFVSTLNNETVIATFDFGNRFYVTKPFEKREYFYTTPNSIDLIQKLTSEGFTHVYYSDRGIKALGDFNPDTNFIIVLQDMIVSKLLTIDYVSDGQYLYRITRN